MCKPLCFEHLQLYCFVTESNGHDVASAMMVVAGRYGVEGGVVVNKRTTPLYVWLSLYIFGTFILY